MSAPRTIAVDFDGTICDFAYPYVGAPKKGVRQALEKFKALGFQIIVFSCRTSHYLPEIFGEKSCPERQKAIKAMVDFLAVHQIPYDSIDSGELGKPLADYYIDDKAVRFENNWAAIAHAIEANETHPTYKLYQPVTVVG